MTIRVLIVDDEKPARDELIFLLSQFPSFALEVCGEATNGEEALDKIESLSPDVVFLDIEMPILTGVEVVQTLVTQSGKIPKIVFVTAYNQFAIKAFELNAVDYILKPIEKDRLQKTLEKVTVKHSSEISPDKVFDLVKQIGGLNSKKRLALCSSDRYIPVDFEQVIYATVIEKKTYVYTAKGCFEFFGTLQRLEEILNVPNFFRPHKSFLINLEWVVAVELALSGSYLIKLRDVETKIPVSRSQLAEFRKIMNIE